ncbi:hypothetical protein [Streptomyces sp. N35]|uniref:hypothetical protein n=1 Tax=Streptomyces sp. N35 TaxID=2795730 RepID=UPI0018F7073C|nr:hypothetical protein [Streptomyces sp. N35]
MPSPYELHEESVAYVDIITACLKRYGVTNSTTSDTFRGPRTLTELRYGSADPAWAAKYGYWMPGDDKAPPAERETDPDEQKLLEGTVPTYKGKKVSAGGCVGEARAQLSGVAGVSAKDYGSLLAVTNELETNAYHAAQSDPAVKEAQQAWSSCMKSKGYTFPADVFAASNSLDLPDIRKPPATGSAEVKLAIADAQCVQKSGIIQAWSSKESALQKAEIAKNPQKWKHLQGQYRARQELVQKALKNHR